MDDKVAVFESELKRIYNKRVREFTRLCVTQAPDYLFIDCPASTTGKYHPLDELGPDGVIIHTKKVFTVAYELCKGTDCESNRDLILSACICHDLVKQGDPPTGHTHKLHNEFGVKLIDDVQNDTLMLDEYQHIVVRNCVGYHYGPWSTEPWLKPINQYTPEELTVYMADFVASKRFVHVDYEREETYV